MLLLLLIYLRHHSVPGAALTDRRDSFFKCSLVSLSPLLLPVDDLVAGLVDDLGG
jgi:hypothetical protein